LTNNYTTNKWLFLNTVISDNYWKVFWITNLMASVLLLRYATYNILYTYNIYANKLRHWLYFLGICHSFKYLYTQSSRDSQIYWCNKRRLYKMRFIEMTKYWKVTIDFLFRAAWGITYQEGRTLLGERMHAPRSFRLQGRIGWIRIFSNMDKRNGMNIQWNGQVLLPQAG
jgi:hypothetical protein